MNFSSVIIKQANHQATRMTRTLTKRQFTEDRYRTQIPIYYKEARMLADVCCKNSIEREIIVMEIRSVMSDIHQWEDELIEMGVEEPRNFSFGYSNWTRPGNTYEYRKQFKMMLKRHGKYTVRLWEEKQNKVERVISNCKNNHFDKLPGDIQEKIFKQVHNSLMSECMKELPTSELLHEVASWTREQRWCDNKWFKCDHKYDMYGVRDSLRQMPRWMIDLRAKFGYQWSRRGQFQRDPDEKNRTTYHTRDDLIGHLMENGFKVTTRMKKDELIRLCLSF